MKSLKTLIGILMMTVLILTSCSGENSEKSEQIVEAHELIPEKEVVKEELQLKFPETLNDTSQNGWFDVTMVVYKPGEESYIGYAAHQAFDQMSPYSTFKIPHALIALELGLVTTEDSSMSWDGTPYSIDEWNQNQTLQTAIENSVVWYFKCLAENIGEDNMKKNLKVLNYGNQDISGGLSDFWLDSTLKISVIEQIDFLEKLYNNDLPFKTENQEYVKSILKIEEKNGKTLYGKTGGGPEFGWFIGYVTDQEGVTYFALNAKDHPKANGLNAKAICLETLKMYGIY